MKKKGLQRKAEFQFRVSLFILKLPPRHSRIPNLVPTITVILSPSAARHTSSPESNLYGVNSPTALDSTWLREIDEESRADS